MASRRDRLGAHVLRDYEGTSLDTLRQMVVMGMGIAFLPTLYVRSEIHRPRELRVTSVHREDIHRTHAFVWRTSSPARPLLQQLANEVRVLVAGHFSQDVTPISETHSR